VSWFPVDAAVDLARDAALFGWLATAAFCAVAGVAIALWGGLRWWAGALLGAVALYLGLLLLLVLAGVRAAERRRDARTGRRTTVGVYVPAPVGELAGPGAPAGPAAGPTPRVHTPPTGTGFRAGVRTGWQRWTRTPPTRSELVVAVLAGLVAAGLVAATQVTWLQISAVGHGVTGFGPFAIQLGLFVVLSAVAALVSAVGLLRWRSAWWPVLLAWFATWWLFVAVEVVRAEGALDALNRLLRDQVRERFGYDARPEITLGVGWTVMVGLGVAMMVLAVVLLVLQGRRTAHYRPVARS
jgi:hypothetical protein